MLGVPVLRLSHLVLFMEPGKAPEVPKVKLFSHVHVGKKVDLDQLRG